MMWGAMKGIKITRFRLAAASLVVAAGLATGARAQEGELFKNLLGGMGIIPQDKGPIEYRERAPLVLPPRMDLREPAVSGSLQASNPQWPNDPDVAARKRQTAEERTPITQTDRYRMNNKNTRLTVDEIRSGRQAGANITTAPQPRRDNAWIHPDVLRAQHEQQRSSAPVAGDEATRRSLTDPPSAYRKSATGQPIRSTWEARVTEDPADPKTFHREQQRR